MGGCIWRARIHISRKVDLAGLWQVLRSFTIEDRLVQAIQALYENSGSAVFFNSQLGEFFKTTVGICLGCLLSPILFNLLLEKIMQETLHDHHTSISFSGRSLCNLQFADNIDPMGDSCDELQDLTNRPVDRAMTYGMEVSTEKSKIRPANKLERGVTVKGGHLNRSSRCLHSHSFDFCSRL